MDLTACRRLYCTDTPPGLSSVGLARLVNGGTDCSSGAFPAADTQSAVTVSPICEFPAPTSDDYKLRLEIRGTGAISDSPATLGSGAFAVTSVDNCVSGPAPIGPRSSFSS